MEVPTLILKENKPVATAATEQSLEYRKSKYNSLK